MVALSSRVQALLWDFRRPADLEKLTEGGQQANIPVAVADSGDVHAVLLSHDLVFGTSAPFSEMLQLGHADVERPIFLLPKPRGVVRGEVVTVRVDVLASGLSVTVL
jgi:hypothetical protein